VNYRTDQWYVSPMNFQPEVRQTLTLPERVFIYDVTLRDGEQTPGVVFDLVNRVRVARAVDGLGVSRIEAGFPSVSDDDRRGVTAVVEAGLQAEIWGFGRCLARDVETNAQCGVKHVLLEISVSDVKMHAFGITKEIVRTRALEALTRAKELGLYTAFMPVDFTRADTAFAEEVVTLAVEKGGADEVVLVDTLGVATPEAVRVMIKNLRQWVQVPLAIHCHNDFGLAVANSLAALTSGARCVHVSVNGLGERAGNAELAEVAMALRLLYGVETGIRLDRLVEAARVVEEVSGYRVGLNKAVVGPRVFTRETGAAIQQLLTSASSVEPYEPAIVGGVRDIVLGKKSGRYSIIESLRRLGMTAKDEEIEAALPLIKDLSVAQRRLITDEEFIAIMHRVALA
jgi:isopropylmalate/homocitrate/citramalate synthase